MLTLLHDYASPASAVAVFRLQALADRGVRLAFEGIEPLPVDVALPVTLDVLDGLRRWTAAAAGLGLDLRRPPRLPATARAHVVGALATSLGLGASWHSTAYRALWEDGRDLADTAVLEDLAGAAGLPDPVAAAAAADDVAVRTFRRGVVRRRAGGVGGVPLLDAGGTLVPASLPDADIVGLARTLTAGA